MKRTMTDGKTGMKRTIMSAFAAIAASLGCVSLAQAETVGYWTFGKTGFSDSSGKGNNLAFTGDGSGVTLGSEGQIVFDGGQKSSLMTSKTYSFPNGYTLEFFIRQLRPQTDLGIVLEFGSKGAFMNDGAAQVLVKNDASKPFVLTDVYWGQRHGTAGLAGQNIRNTADDALADGAWHHVAVVVDPAENGKDTVSRFYFDGVAQPLDATYQNTVFSALNGQPLFFGSRNGKTSFVGELDDVRVSDVPLAPADFLKARSVAEDDISGKVAAHWTFGENGFKDISGNGNDLSAAGVTLGEDGQAIFNANTTACNSSKPIDFGSFTDGYTLEFWVKMPLNPESLEMIAELSTSFKDTPGAMCVDVSDAVQYGISAAYRTKSKYNVRNAVASDTNDGEWHHVAYLVDAKYNGQKWLSQLLIDGQQKELGVNMDGVYVQPPRGKTLYLGSRANSTLRFTGELDNVRVTAAPLDPKDFLPSRTWSPKPAKSVYRMNGENCTIDVPAGDVVEYDAISTGCDNPLIVLSKTGAGVLRIKGDEPFAGVLDIAEGVVTVPAGFVPTIKAVAGRKLTLGKTTITASSGESGFFTLDSVPGYDSVVCPRLAEMGLANLKVKLEGVAQLSLAQKTVHGETGLAQGTDSEVVDLEPGNIGADDFELIDVSGDALKYRKMTTPFLGWTPHGARTFLVHNDATEILPYSGEKAPSGQQVVGLQIAPMGTGKEEAEISRTVLIPADGTYRLNLKAVANKDPTNGAIGDVEIVAKIDAGGQYEILRATAPSSYTKLTGTVTLTAGVHTLVLRAANGVLTPSNWPIVLVDEVEFCRDEADAPNLITSGWSSTGSVTPSAAGDAMTLNLAKDAAITKTFEVPAGGPCVVRIGAKVTCPFNDYELRVNGAVARAGAIVADGDVIVPIGSFAKGDVICLSLKNVTDASGTSNLDRQLALSNIQLEMPGLAAFSGDYQSIRLSLDGATRLWLDYVGRLRVGGLNVDGVEKQGRFSSATNPEFLSSTGMIGVGMGLFIVVQ